MNYKNLNKTLVSPILKRYKVEAMAKSGEGLGNVLFGCYYFEIMSSMVCLMFKYSSNETGEDWEKARVWLNQEKVTKMSAKVPYYY